VQVGHRTATYHNPACQRESAKVNLFCALSTIKIYSPFSFADRTVSGDTYLDMVEKYVAPQVQEDLDEDLVF
jgi:hypothetical protein